MPKMIVDQVARRVRRWDAGRIFSYAALIFLAAAMVGCATSGSGSYSSSGPGIIGTVTAPVEGVYLFVYEKGADPHGPPYYKSAATGPDGAFKLDLPDGEYTVVARKHKNGLAGSPMGEGDQKSAPVDVTVRNGRFVEQDFVLASKTDDVRHFGPGREQDTSISGKVLDSEGNPMKGFRIHVYTYAQMSERPKYVSAATGPDGEYTVYLPKGGTYYIAARDHFGGPPKIGDYYGRYDEGTIDPSGVILKTGQKLDGVNVTVHKIW